MIFQSNIYLGIALCFMVLGFAIRFTRLWNFEFGQQSFIACAFVAFILGIIYADKASVDLSTERLRAMNPDLHDQASNYVLQAYTSLCKHGYDDMSQPCAVAVARNISDSALSDDLKTRARLYVAQHANLSVDALPTIK